MTTVLGEVGVVWCVYVTTGVGEAACWFVWCVHVTTGVGEAACWCGNNMRRVYLLINMF